jgi:hypothetical protein
MTLDKLMYEMNPKHDLSNNSWNTGEDSYKGDFYDWGLYIINTAKSIVRGAAAGAIVGAILNGTYAAATSDDTLSRISDGASLGSRIGFVIDFHQYQARFWFGKIKSDIKRGRVAWKNIMNAYKDD